MYERILVPIDGSATAARGLDEAMGVARLTHATIRLIHVLDEMPFVAGAEMAPLYSSELIAQVRGRGEAILEQAKQRVEAAGIPVDTMLRDTLEGRVCDFVADEARTWKADLIAIGTHGRRGATRLFLGSDAEQILRLAPVPVLLVRAAESAKD